MKRHISDYPCDSKLFFVANIGPKSDGKKGKGKAYGSGKETLRFRSNGPVIEEAVRFSKMFSNLFTTKYLI